MKKMVIVLIVLWLSSLGITAGNAEAASLPFEWYFGDNPQADYVITVTEPTVQIFIPSTFIAFEDGDVVGAGVWGTRNGVPNNLGVDDWYLGFSQSYPAPEGHFVGGTTYQWIPNSIISWPYGQNVPDGVYAPQVLYSSLNYWEDDAHTILVSVHPINSFQITVRNQANPIPEPEIYALMVAGLGLLGFAARRRKQQAA